MTAIHLLGQMHFWSFMFTIKTILIPQFFVSKKKKKKTLEFVNLKHIPSTNQPT